MNAKQRMELAIWLDERFDIAVGTDSRLGNLSKNFLPSNIDYVYYKAILDTLRLLGMEWKRSASGKHYIF